jgi:hypothetical protein
VLIKGIYALVPAKAQKEATDASLDDTLVLSDRLNKARITSNETWVSLKPKKSLPMCSREETKNDARRITMKQTKALVSQIRGGGGDMKSILLAKDTTSSLSCNSGKMRSVLTLLTASFILLVMSFTFSSCKSCNKNKAKDDGRSGKTSIDGNSNTPDGSSTSNRTRTCQSSDGNSNTPDGSSTFVTKELMSLDDIERLVDKAAGYAYAAWVAKKEAHIKNHNASETDKASEMMIITKKKLQEVVNARKEVEKLMQEVVAAEKPAGKATADNVEAIELLLLKIELDLSKVKFWAENAKFNMARAMMFTALTAYTRARLAHNAAQTADTEATEAEEKAALERWERWRVEKAQRETAQNDMHAAYVTVENKWAVARNDAQATAAGRQDALRIARAAFVKEAKSKGKSDQGANAAFIGC